MRLLHRGKLNGGKILQPTVTTGLFGGKPAGENILWTSPMKSAFGWIHYLAEQNGGYDNEEEVSATSIEELVAWDYTPYWLVELNEKARIAKVNTLADLKALASKYQARPPLYLYPVDWPCLAKDYDAFWLTRKGQRETHASYPLGLWGFDCETVIVFNAAVISGYAAYP